MNDPNCVVEVDSKLSIRDRRFYDMHEDCIIINEKLEGVLLIIESKINFLLGPDDKNESERCNSTAGSTGLISEVKDLQLRSLGLLDKIESLVMRI